MKNIAAVISILGLGLAATVGASSAAESDEARNGVRVYASYASPHAPEVMASAQARNTIARDDREVTKDVQDAQARVSTDAYVSAHLLAVGQYRGEEGPAPRPAKPAEKG